jgi:hypothetical protein
MNTENDNLNQSLEAVNNAQQRLLDIQMEFSRKQLENQEKMFLEIERKIRIEEENIKLNKEKIQLETERKKECENIKQLETDRINLLNELLIKIDVLFELIKVSIPNKIDDINKNIEHQHVLLINMKDIHTFLLPLILKELASSNKDEIDRVYDLIKVIGSSHGEIKVGGSTTNIGKEIKGDLNFKGDVHATK